MAKKQKFEPFVMDRNDHEQIRIGVSDFKGRYSLDIRTWWRDRDDEDGEYKPSSKGCSIPILKSKKFIKGLRDWLKEDGIEQIERAIGLASEGADVDEEKENAKKAKAKKRHPSRDEDDED